MSRIDLYKRLLLATTEQLQESQTTYHFYIQGDVLDLLREAQEAKPKRLAVIVEEVEARLSNKGFPPGMR